MNSIDNIISKNYRSVISITSKEYLKNIVDTTFHIPANHIPANTSPKHLEAAKTGEPAMNTKAKMDNNESKATADVKRFNTSLHARLISLTEESAGFAASEVTGYSAAQVRKAAEAMAEAGLLIRWKVSPRRVRYFSTEEQAKAFKPAPVVGRVAGPNGGTRMKAGWSADEPGIITPQTKITIAPRLPRNVYRSNTYLKF